MTTWVVPLEFLPMFLISHLPHLLHAQEPLDAIHTGDGVPSLAQFQSMNSTLAKLVEGQWSLQIEFPKHMIVAHVDLKATCFLGIP